MQTVRVRNNAKVTQLNIPSHKVETIKYIQGTVFAPKRRSTLLKDLLGHAPTVKLEYDLGGFSKIEYYCDSCASKVYERDEPQDRDSLAKKYGIIAMDSDDMPRRDIYNITD